MGLHRAINRMQNCWHPRPGRAVSGAQKTLAGSGMAWQLLRAGRSLSSVRGLGLPARGEPGAAEREAGSWQLGREDWVGLAEGTKGRALRQFIPSCEGIVLPGSVSKVRAWHPCFGVRVEVGCPSSLR